jgi:hypothetical protein
MGDTKVFVELKSPEDKASYLAYRKYIPLWEATKKLIELEREEYLKFNYFPYFDWRDERYLANQRIMDYMVKKIKDLEKELAVAQEQLAVKEEENKVVPFPNPKLKLITGGRPPEWHPRWLDELAIGSVFTVENKQDPNDFIEGLFIILLKTEESAYLKNLNSEHDIRTWVKIQRFCRRYQLVDFLDIIDKPEEKHFEETEE